MLLWKTFEIAVVGAGICFICYCFYFDKKRRSDSDFQTKLKERRRKSRQQKSQNSTTTLPNLSNVEASQRFFLQEVQKGEELLAIGDIPRGVEQLCKTVALCDQPQLIRKILQQTLAPRDFAFLEQRLLTVMSLKHPSVTVSASAAHKNLDKEEYFIFLRNHVSVRLKLQIL